MNEQFFLGMLAGIGGTAGIVVFILKRFVDIIVLRLQKKYEIKLQFDIENFKNQLMQETYLFKARHSALEDLSCSFSSIFDVIIYHTKGYDEDSSKKPSKQECLEIKNLISNTRIALHKIIAVFENTTVQPLEKIFGCLSEQHERLCCGILGSAPYTLDVIESKLIEFKNYIPELQKSIGKQ